MKDQKCEIFLIELGEDNAPVHARFRPMNVSPVAVRFDLRSRVPGLMLAFAIALVAWWLGRLMPLVGGPVIGILLGIAVRNLAAPDARFAPGIAFAG